MIQGYEEAHTRETYGVLAEGLRVYAHLQFPEALTFWALLICDHENPTDEEILAAAHQSDPTIFLTLEEAGMIRRNPAGAWMVADHTVTMEVIFDPEESVLLDWDIAKIGCPEPIWSRDVAGHYAAERQKLDEATDFLLQKS